MNSSILQAASIIERGGVICFPTETVYALACNALDKKAVLRVYELKGRDFTKPLAILAKDKEQIEKMSVTDSRFESLCDKFSPGPISYILPKKEDFMLPQGANYREDTIAVRIPDNEIAMQILNAAKCPVAATSANISGEDEAKDERSVRAIFEGKVDFIIGGQKSRIGMASTIVDLCSNQIKILRQGVITKDDIDSVLIQDKNK